MLQPAIHSFKRIGFLWRISLSHPFFHVGCFSQSSCRHAFLQGYFIYCKDILQPSIRSGVHSTSIFWQNYLLRTALFLEELPKKYDFFEGFISPLHLQPSTLCSRVSVFVTERVAVICSLKDIVFTLTGDLAVIHCLSNYFNSGMFISIKIGSSYAFFRRYFNYFYRSRAVDTVIG